MVCETGSRPGYGMKATMMGRQFRMSRSRDLAMVMVLLSIGLLLLAGGAGAQVRIESSRSHVACNVVMIPAATDRGFGRF